MPDDNQLEMLYEQVLEGVEKDALKIPSLPDITMNVRKELDSESGNFHALVKIISKDPALTAYLVQMASSPMYRRTVQPKTLLEVLTLLGMKTTNSLVTLHSLRSLVEIKDKTAEKIFLVTWRRLVVKTSIMSFLAKKLAFKNTEYAQMAMLLTEVGSLCVLSHMLQSDQAIDEQLFFAMCKKFSRRIGYAALGKWNIDENIIQLVAQCGNWDETWPGKLCLLDIANLSLYHAVLMTIEKPNLPPLESLAAIRKLPPSHQSIQRENWLVIVDENQDEIQEIIDSFA